MEGSDEAPIIKSEPGVSVPDEAAPVRSINNQKAQNGMQSLQQAADIASQNQMAILHQQLGLGVQSQQQADMHASMVVQQHGGSSTSSEGLTQNQVSASSLYTSAAGNLQQGGGEYVIPGTAGLLQAGSGFVPVPIVPHPEAGGDENDMPDTRHDHVERELREQDRFLPIANVARIMKKAIPENGKIAKDAKECVQECVSEFISFITSEASERCHQEKRKTINGEDILCAMSTLGFDNYVEPLKVYLTKYRESIKGEKIIGIDFPEEVDMSAEGQQTVQQYQIATGIHPGIVSSGLVSADGTYTPYSTSQIQLQQQQQANIHFS